MAENTAPRQNGTYYLMCERFWVFWTLIVIAGFWGAYTYLVRGHVFCNAQTANLLYMGLALGDRRWSDALYYLIPMAAYILGAFISELFPNPVKHHSPIRWDTLLIIIDMVAMFLIGLIPLSAPVQIAQVAINFLASMQYNTFRQAEGITMATTFCTNHIRQIGVGLAKELRHRQSGDTSHRLRFRRHTLMVLAFLTGVVVGVFCCALLAEKAIWVTLLPFSVLLAAFLHSDLTTERAYHERKPAGH